MVRFLVLDCRSFVVKVDRTYRLCCGPGDFRPARGWVVRLIAQTRVKLFNPCTQQSSQYFAASEDA